MAHPTSNLSQTPNLAHSWNSLSRFPAFALAAHCRPSKHTRAPECLALHTHDRKDSSWPSLEGFSRRSFVLWTTATVAGFMSMPACGEDELATFENAKQKYRLQRPAQWEQVNKAGADALFKATNAKSTDIGVTVNAIKIKRLEQLGDVEAAGKRLLAAERKKESTKSIDMLQQTSSTGQSGTEFYIFDYTISTTRGDKRIISKVGVANSNLYIANGSIKCEGDACREATPVLTLVKRSIDSFDIITAQG